MSNATSLHGTPSLIFSNIAVRTYNPQVPYDLPFVSMHAQLFLFVHFFMAVIHFIGSSVPENMFY
jgi:hypothetical protein